MIKDGLKKDEIKTDDMVDFKTLSVLAIATSIDALAVGITFAFLKTNIISSAVIIGAITFLLSLIGINIGKKFGNMFKLNPELIGGIILILIGTKILLEHLEIINAILQ